MKKNTMIIILTVLIIILGGTFYLTNRENNNLDNKNFTDNLENNKNNHQTNSDNQNVTQDNNEQNDNTNKDKQDSNPEQNNQQIDNQNSSAKQDNPQNNNQNISSDGPNNDRKEEDNEQNENNDDVINTDNKSEIIENNLVSYNGTLSIKNNSLVNKYGEKIQLKGISTHGLQWYGEFANEQVIRTLRDEWGTNLFRIAMYTNENGYIQNRNLKEKVKEIVNIAIKLDMYVIIDWHILSDGNPLIYKEEAKEFFREMSLLYKDTPNVIYEICNEPNGVDWDNSIKPYAEEVISVIRENSKNSIIIVGTGTWSQDVDKAALNPINDRNVMYALHFYSGTHKDWLRDRAKDVLNKIPLFVSEWGVSDASGNGGIFLDEAKKWINFMNENNLSFAVWSLSNKNESSALLLPGAPSNNIYDNYLSEAGKFIKQNIK